MRKFPDKEKPVRSKGFFCAAGMNKRNQIYAKAGSEVIPERMEADVLLHKVVDTVNKTCPQARCSLSDWRDLSTYGVVWIEVLADDLGLPVEGPTHRKERSRVYNLVRRTVREFGERRNANDPRLCRG